MVPISATNVGTTKADNKRVVRLVYGTRPRGRHVLYAFGYSSVANLCGMTEASVKKAALPRRGRAPTLDMADLESVAAFIAKHQK